MNSAISNIEQSATPKTFNVGCVSFLNALPLIDGFETRHSANVHFDVPSRLLDDLENQQVDIALCPVIDLQRSRNPLVIVPSGGIGCDGPTLTVRLYSKQPIETLTTVYADTDSHTSVALLRVLLKELHDITPELIDYNTNMQAADNDLIKQPDAVQPDAMLLIGDKVVTAAPSPDVFPHQMDLGQAWSELTNLPFVFAVWMTNADTQLGNLPTVLDQTRQYNAGRIDQLVKDNAQQHGWPDALARQYLGDWLRYNVGPRQLEAMNLFFDKAHQHGVIDNRRPVQLYRANIEP